MVSKDEDGIRKHCPELGNMGQDQNFFFYTLVTLVYKLYIHFYFYLFLV